MTFSLQNILPDISDISPVHHFSYVLDHVGYVDQLDNHLIFSVFTFKPKCVGLFSCQFLSIFNGPIQNSPNHGIFSFAQISVKVSIW